MWFSIHSAFAFLCLLSELAIADVTLVRVIDSKNDAHVGILVKETENQIDIRDLKDGTDRSFAKTGLKKLEKGISDDVAISTIGVAPVTACRIAALASQPNNSVGKIAQVKQSVIYVTLGEKSGIAVKQKLTVFRNMGEIRDPDTNKLLGSERLKIGVLEVTEVSQDYSKSRTVSDLEVQLAAGDEVEWSRPRMQIAVLPLRFEKETDDQTGILIAEDLTTQLIRQSVPVIERSLVDKVLTEQVLQNTVFFDPDGIQRIGHLIGASTVLSGKIVVGEKENTAYVRLIDVQTGKILYAVRTPVKQVKRNSTEPKKTSTESKKVTANPTAPPENKKFVSRDVELTENAPANWILKEAVPGTILFQGREYAFTELPKEIEGGTLILREGMGGWLAGGAVRALTDCDVYAIVRYRAHGKDEIGEVTFVNFDREGWEDIGEVTTNVTVPFDWRFKALRKRVPKGYVFLQLARINFGNEGALFVFKADPAKLTVESPADASQKKVDFRSKKIFRSDVVEFTSKAPSGWIFKEAKIATPAWSDRGYLITKLPEGAVGGTLLWRSSEEKAWLPTGTIKGLKDCTVYVFALRSAYGKEQISEVTLTKMQQDGWEDAGDVAVSYPNGEDWQFIALSKQIKAGDVHLQLSSVNWGNQSLFFVFK